MTFFMGDSFHTITNLLYHRIFFALPFFAFLTALHFFEIDVKINVRNIPEERKTVLAGFNKNGLGFSGKLSKASSNKKGNYGRKERYDV